MTTTNSNGERPNIFKYATKELSQDAFFSWLLQWADKKYSSIDPNLAKIAECLIRRFLQKNDIDINSIKIKKQYKNIDILAIINDEHVICIEDKTYTSEHSRQLERYKKTIEKDFKNKQHYFIYLKTGNESTKNLEKILSQGYTPINRSDILKIINEETITNNIFCDFRDHLQKLEDKTNSFKDFEKLKKSVRAGEGLFIELDTKLKGNWKYCSNPDGGFLEYYYYHKKLNELDPFTLYIQIQHTPSNDNNAVKIALKIRDYSAKSTGFLKNIFKEIKKIADQKGITICPPDKFKVGKTSTIAFVENVLDYKNEWLTEFYAKLDLLQSVIDDYFNKYN